MSFFFFFFFFFSLDAADVMRVEKAWIWSRISQSFITSNIQIKNIKWSYASLKAPAEQLLCFFKNDFQI